MAEKQASSRQPSTAQRAAWPVAASAACVIALLSLFDKSEGFKLDPYYDSVGVLTVCRGLTNSVAPIMGRSIVYGQSWTREECVEAETRVINRFNAQVRQCANEAPVTLYEQVAWLHFAWNIGISAFCGSTAAKRLRERRYEEACDQILRWNRAGGRDCRVRENDCYGIVVRRQMEHALCNGRIKVPGLPGIRLD